MSVWEAIILGIVQGLTEFLPISSSGHLIIMQKLLGLENPENADLLFDMLLHLGTLIAVFIAFYKLILSLIKSFFTSIPQVLSGKLKWKNADENQRMILLLIISILPLFFIVPLMNVIEELYSTVLVVGIALMVNSIILFLSDKIMTGKKDASSMKIKDAAAIGLMQIIAIIPGISRSGSTITAGLFCGLGREYAAKYSFIMSIPTILGGIVLNIIHKMQQAGGIDTSLIPVYLIGVLTAAICGFFAIKLLQYLLKSKKFIIFSIYCFIVGIAVIIWTLV
ncbi:MAG: putative bacitracin resistance protein [Clostridia bacterium]|jgi:undecaprenyl-diphosphatase|nr:putative bacitracin resistance protein [Clostridia bacterium]